MKFILTLILSIFTLSANAELASDTVYGDDESTSLQEKIVEIYNAEIKDENSNLFLALTGFANKNEISFMRDTTEDDIGSMSVDLETNIGAGSGKGSCCSHASTVLVPIWASFKGTGLIEEMIGFLKVGIYVELGEESATTKYSIENIVPFSVH